MESARRAETVDLPRMLELYDDLASELDGYRGRWAELEAWADPAAYLEARIGDPSSFVALGAIDDYPVGFAAVDIAHPHDCPTRPGIGLVRALFVEPPAREVGVGEALLDAIVQWLAENDVRSADITVSPGHRAAKNFCEDHGFVARTLTMHSNW